MRLTQNLIKEHSIEITSQTIDNLALPRPVTVYFIQSDNLKVNWSGIGRSWLRLAKKELLKVIGAKTRQGA